MKNAVKDSMRPSTDSAVETLAITHDRPSSRLRLRWRSPLGIALWIGLAITALTWAVLAWNSFLAVAPYLLILTCPLMHLWMHRSMSHGHHQNHAASDASATPRS